MDEHEALRQIADLVAPHVSTRFVDGDPLADEIETVLEQAGVRLQDGPGGRAQRWQPQIPHNAWYRNHNARSGRVDWAPYPCTCEIGQDHDAGSTELSSHDDQTPPPSPFIPEKR